MMLSKLSYIILNLILIHTNYCNNDTVQFWEVSSLYYNDTFLLKQPKGIIVIPFDTVCVINKKDFDKLCSQFIFYRDNKIDYRLGNIESKDLNFKFCNYVFDFWKIDTVEMNNNVYERFYINMFNNTQNWNLVYSYDYGFIMFNSNVDYLDSIGYLYYTNKTVPKELRSELKW